MRIICDETKQDPNGVVTKSLTHNLVNNIVAIVVFICTVRLALNHVQPSNRWIGIAQNKLHSVGIFARNFHNSTLDFLNRFNKYNSNYKKRLAKRIFLIRKIKIFLIYE